jgi:very-short-patch-repair endonuclease
MQPAGKTHVTVDARVRQQPTIRVHSPRCPLQRGELTRARGLRATTVPRTLLDLAAAGVEVERLVAEAVARRLVSMEVLRAYVESRAGARGAARLRRAIEGKQTRSGLERRFVAFVRRHGVPEPEMNVRIGALTVDALWRDAGLVAEIDSIGTHGTAHSFEKDRLRDAYLVARGLRCIRVTDRRLAEDPVRLAADLRAALRHV